MLLLGLSNSAVIAQPWLPGFSVNSTTGCAPFTTVITNLSNAPDSVVINYDWGDGSGLTIDTVHLYNNSGTYTIVQTVANALPRTDTVIVEVVATPQPEFIVSNCIGTQGSVYIPDRYYEAYFVDWGDFTTDIIPADIWFSHNFGASATYNITVKGLINGAQTELDSSNFRCGSKIQALTTSPALVPGKIDEIAVLNIDPLNGEIQLQYTLDPNTTYIVEGRPDGAGSYVVYDTLNMLSNPSSIVISDLNTESHFYCFRITAVDPCTSSVVPTAEACSMRAFAVSEVDQNRIIWDSESADFLEYEIFKNGHSFVKVNTQSSREYIDNNVSCGALYCYWVEMHENNGLTSRSDTICVTSSSAGVSEPIININASIDGENVNVSWQPPFTFPAKGYIPGRLVNDGTFEPLDTLIDTNITDPDLAVNGKRYFYRVLVMDECDNVSDSSALAGTLLLKLGINGLLTWPKYEGWYEGVSSYVLEKYDMEKQLILNIPMGQDTSFTDNPGTENLQGVFYRVQARPIDSHLEPVYSNFVQIIYRSEVFFPNAFSPNGDDLNDFFTFEGRFIASGSIKIYSRWGELIFETSQIDVGWDGKINGHEASVGTYVYSAQLTDESGVQFIKTGQVVLIR